ncbi:Glutathione transferase FosA [Pseudobythopirellula maris]|uniref:Glutathione transferase FosA n=1 Tax=Pseudobythopirellula maris TaxID=2527991 RepID=A0A5C5ZWE3_9BACT|nr:VOC family protein [Pseudobythopirellula maris]TWT90573.1 Glutathione transferase FosA [Pseudobythopirellula maris]
MTASPTPPVEVGRFNHAAIVSLDVERSVAFYASVLGFRRTARPAFSFDGAWLYCDGLGMMLHLIHDAAFDPTPPATKRLNHLAFRVDVDHAKERLTALGVDFREKRLPTLGYRQLFLLDPDGHQLELGEWPEPEELARLPFPTPQPPG